MHKQEVPNPFEPSNEEPPVPSSHLFEKMRKDLSEAKRLLARFSAHLDNWKMAEPEPAQ